jgi:hypothetical protein
MNLIVYSRDLKYLFICYKYFYNPWNLWKTEKNKINIDLVMELINIYTKRQYLEDFLSFFDFTEVERGNFSAIYLFEFL